MQSLFYLPVYKIKALKLIWGQYKKMYVYNMYIFIIYFCYQISNIKYIIIRNIKYLQYFNISKCNKIFYIFKKNQFGMVRLLMDLERKC